MYTLVFMKLIFLQDFKELNCCCFQNKHSGSACDKLNKFFMSIYFINSSDQNIVPFSYIVTILCWMPRFLVNKRESLVAFNVRDNKKFHPFVWFLDDILCNSRTRSLQKIITGLVVLIAFMRIINRQL